MDYDSLSQNGIQKVINNAPSVVQIIDFQIKQRGDTNFYIVELSDGFARLKKCVIMPENQKKVKNFDVIKTQIVTPNMRDGKPQHVLIDQYKIIKSDINVMIGDPIEYVDWQKTKRNPKGDNMFPQQKKTMQNAKPNKGPIKSGVNVASLFDDQEEHNQNGLSAKNTKNVGINKKSSQITSTQSISHSIKPNIQNKNNQSLSNQGPPSNRNSNNYSNNQAKQISNQAKPQNNRTPQQQTRHDRTHTLIKQLYEGMEDWKLKVRVIFMSQVKTYIKKANGQQSQLFAFQACDQLDSIQMTVFGESAVNFAQTIELDNIYEISVGKVVKDERNNRLRIILTQKSVINLLQDDLTIPMVDEFCLTPQKLLQKDIGTDWNVVALVKDNNQIVEFVSKNGKNCKKKEISLCDPQAQIEVPITLWFDKADIKFQKIPYAFQGISVSSFNDQKQFQASIKFNYRPFKQHQFRKFINTYDKMKLQNPVHDFSGRNKAPNFQLVNFSAFRIQAEKLQNNNTLTMEKNCYLTQISLAGRNCYMSCPFCKKKVMDEQNGSCASDKCGKSYQRAKFRYLLNVSLTDEVDTIWATAYDDAAEVMLTSEIDGSILTADDYVKIDQEDLKLKIPAFLDREMKVVITAKKQTYNGQQRVKYAVNKAILDIDFVAQSNILMKQIQYLTNSIKGR